MFMCISKWNRSSDRGKWKKNQPLIATLLPIIIMVLCNNGNCFAHKIDLKVKKVTTRVNVAVGQNGNAIKPINRSMGPKSAIISRHTRKNKQIRKSLARATSKPNSIHDAFFPYCLCIFSLPLTTFIHFHDFIFIFFSIQANPLDFNKLVRTGGVSFSSTTCASIPIFISIRIWFEIDFYFISFTCARNRYHIAFDLMNVRVRIDVIYQEERCNILRRNALNQSSITISNE